MSFNPPVPSNRSYLHAFSPHSESEDDRTRQLFLNALAGHRRASSNNASNAATRRASNPVSQQQTAGGNNNGYVLAV